MHRFIYLVIALVGPLGCDSGEVTPATEKASSAGDTASQKSKPPEPHAAPAKEAPKAAAEMAQKAPEVKKATTQPTPKARPPQKDADLKTLPASRFALKPLQSRRFFKHEPVDAPPPTRGPDLLGSLGPKTKGDLRELSDAAKAGKPIQRRGAPPIRQIDKYRFEIGRIKVDQEKKRLTVLTNVNQIKGILEYVAVGPSGKTHESVLTYIGLPSHVHLGLLLLGLEPKKKRGPKVNLTVEWTDPKSGKMKRAPISQWLFDRTTQEAAAMLPWRFSGSSFWRGQYGGDSSHTLISTIPDGNAVIEADTEAGNPYRGDNLGYEVNQLTIPPKGTSVKLYIAPVAKKNSP